MLWSMSCPHHLDLVFRDDVDTENLFNNRKSDCQQGRSDQTKWLTVVQIWLPGATGQPLMSILVNGENSESKVMDSKDKQKSKCGIRRTQTFERPSCLLIFHEDTIWPWQPHKQWRTQTTYQFLHHAKCASCRHWNTCHAGGIK